MNVRSSVAVAGLAVVGTLGFAGPAAAQTAQTACDAYSRGCVEPPAVLPQVLTPPAETPPADAGEPATVVQPRTVVRPQASSPATLPFTGGELVLVSTLGLAAVGGGVALVVAGRRRSAPTA